MPTYDVRPPPLEERMAFMDALEEAAIAVSRTPESFVVDVAHGQEAAWDDIRRRFRLEIDEGEPPMLLGS